MIKNFLKNCKANHPVALPERDAISGKVMNNRDMYLQNGR